MRNLLLVVFLSILPIVVLAQNADTAGPVGGRDTLYLVSQNGNMFTSFPLNVAQTTDAIKVRGYRWFAFELQYVFSAASAVVMTCQTSEDAVTWYDLHDSSCLKPTPDGTPNFVSQPQSWSYAVAASHNWTWVVSSCFPYLRCTFTGTGAAAGDKLTLTGRAGYGQ